MAQEGFKTLAGEVVPYGSWRSVGHGISIRPLKTRYHVRLDATGEVDRPVGPAGRDDVMMALYHGKVPGYAAYCFGPAALAGVPPEAFYRA